MYKNITLVFILNNSIIQLGSNLSLLVLICGKIKEPFVVSHFQTQQNPSFLSML